MKWSWGATGCQNSYWILRRQIWDMAQKEVIIGKALSKIIVKPEFSQKFWGGIAPCSSLPVNLFLSVTSCQSLMDIIIADKGLFSAHVRVSTKQSPATGQHQINCFRMKSTMFIIKWARSCEKGRGYWKWFRKISPRFVQRAPLFSFLDPPLLTT